MQRVVRAQMFAEGAVELMADRFAVTEGACAVDLATGGAVLLRVEPIDDVGHARWTLRRDTLGRLRHRSLAPLVDYGPLGASNRFEAWSMAGPWRGAADAERRARASVAAFLDGCGFVADASAGRVYRSASGAPVVVPGRERGAFSRGRSDRTR